jgi:hypothetical protein
MFKYKWKLSSVGDIATIDVPSVFLLVEPVSITNILLGVVTVEAIGGHLLVCIPEVDVAHVLFVVEEIGVKSIVVPEVVLVVFAFPVALNHEPKEFSHAVGDVSPEKRTSHIEPRVSCAEHLVVGVVWETFVAGKVGESMLKSNEGVLPKGEAAEPEDTYARAGVSSPMSVKVHLDGLVEHTIATSNSITLDTLTEISRLAG